MSAVQIKVLSSTSPRAESHVAAVESLARGLAAFLLVASVLVVLFAATFPFDFAAPAHADVWRHVRQTFDTRWVQHDPKYADRAQNVLFFVPSGFGLAAMLRPRKARVFVQLAVAPVAGALLTTTVEVLQTLVSFRDPSLMDVWCNTLGAIVGAGLFALFGDRSLRAAAGALLKLRPLARPAVLGGAVGFYAVAHLAAPFLMHHAGDLSVWDPTMPLLLGNELSGDRGWNGAVAEVVLADRAATPEEVAVLARGADPALVFEGSLVASYALRGSAPYRDAAGNLPPLERVGDPPLVVVGDQAFVSPQNWLKTPDPVAKAVRRIARTSQFTLATTGLTFETNQTGPARIVGISASTGQRNAQLLQEGSDLVVRVRTAVRTMPDLYLRNVLADTSTHHLAVTQADGVVVIYVDGNEAGRCEITPEAKIIWRLYPRGTFRIRLERYGFRSYAAIYRLLVFIPFAGLLGAALMTSRLPPRGKRLVAAGVTAGFALLLEIILGTQAASGFQTKNLLISLAISFATLGALAWWRKRRRQAAS